MSSWFSKLQTSAKKAAQDGMAIISNVTKEASVTASLLVNQGGLFGDEIENQVRSYMPSPPEIEILRRFRHVCDEIDRLADREDPYSNDTDKLLYDSKVKSNLNKMFAQLQIESDAFLCRNSVQPDPKKDTDFGSLPCLQKFLNSNILLEICYRASVLNLKGLLPMILIEVAPMLSNLPYPILRYEQVHRPIADIISIAARYESVHDDDKSSGKTLEAINYKERIGNLTLSSPLP